MPKKVLGGIRPGQTSLLQWFAKSACPTEVPQSPTSGAQPVDSAIEDAPPVKKETLIESREDGAISAVRQQEVSGVIAPVPTEKEAILHTAVAPGSDTTELSREIPVSEGLRSPSPQAVPTATSPEVVRREVRGALVPTLVKVPHIAAGCVGLHPFSSTRSHL